MKVTSKSIIKGSLEVEEMYRLCFSYNVKVSSQDMVGFDDLKAFGETYSARRREADTYVSDRRLEMSSALDMNIARLGDQVAALRRKITDANGVFVDASRDPINVLAEIQTLRGRLDQCIELSETYAEYQQLFDVEPYDFKRLQDTQGIFDQYMGIWSARHKWDESMEEWLGHDFTKLSVERLNDSVQSAYKYAYKMDKRLKNGISRMHKQKIGEFKRKIPVIIELETR